MATVSVKTKPAKSRKKTTLGMENAAKQYRFEVNKASKLYKLELNDIVDRICEAADEKGWSYRDFAECSGLHVNTIVRIYNRHVETPYFKTVWKMAVSLGMSVKVE